MILKIRLTLNENRFLSTRVIYLSLEKVNEALEAYKKASSLEPQNENYKQSIRICEDRLGAGHGAGAMGGVCQFIFIFNYLRIDMFIEIIS